MGGRGHSLTRAGTVLIVSHDVVDVRMAGPGIRYWELARVLAEHRPVILAVPEGTSLLSPDGVQVRSYEPQRWDSLALMVHEARAVLLSGDVLAWFPRLREDGPPLIVDGYDPHTLETLALFAGSPEQSERHETRERILLNQCLAGDFFICASERQRDWWLGLLEATGRINSDTYAQDPSLRQLVDVVPFGLRSTEPQRTAQVLKGVHPRIDPEDKVILWGGGLWQWLDPLTAIRGMALVREERDDVRLVFPGTRHPNPAVGDMPVRRESVQLAEELDLLDRCVLFGDWVPYHDWSSYLLEADIGVSLHLDTIEARLAFRSRVMDYLWASLPMVVTKGDAASDLVSKLELGEVVSHGAEDEFAEAVLRLLREGLSGSGPRFAEARADLTWERAARPLIAFCERPGRAPDRRGVDAVPEAGRIRSELSADESRELRQTLEEQAAEIAELRDLVSGYEDGRFMRLMRWLHRLRHSGGTT